MGGSEGVMQVADYGEIQFETWLNSSYGQDRRTRVLPTALGGSTLLATSTTAAVSAIPMGEDDPPGTNTIVNGNAYYVRSSGSVASFDLHASYGRLYNRRARIGTITHTMYFLLVMHILTAISVVIISEIPTGLSA